MATGLVLHGMACPAFHALDVACRHRSEDEARDTFKMLKSQLIGDSFAYLYSEWAMLEDVAGEEPHLALS